MYMYLSLSPLFIHEESPFWRNNEGVKGGLSERGRHIYYFLSCPSRQDISHHHHRRERNAKGARERLEEEKRKDNTQNSAEWPASSPALF